MAAQETLKRRDERIKHLENKNQEMQPKALFADAVAASNSTILIGDLAKILKGNGIEIGQNRLFGWMRDNGYLIKSGSSRNMPTQRSMNMKLFEVKERTIGNPDGSIRVTKTTKVTGKGQEYFVNEFLNMKEEAADAVK
jgi:anti-repressor protein